MIARLWKKVSYIGIDEEKLSFKDIKIRLFFNRALLFLIVILILKYLSVSYVLINKANIFFVISQVIILVSFLLTARGYFGIAKRLVIYGIYVLIMVFVLNNGGKLFVHYTGITLLVFSLMVFDVKKELIERILIFIISIFLVFVGESNVGGKGLELHGEKVNYVRIFMISVNLLGVALFINLINYIMHNYDLALEELLEQHKRYLEIIDDMNDELAEKNELLKKHTEELQAVNEELKLKNEEIRSQAEELKALNEELQNINLQLFQRNKDLTDSINYARRLQRAILPPEELLLKKFSEVFVLYKPKEIVAGDFYWIYYDENKDVLFFAVGDCTGHGVPGAIVSFLAINSLNRAVKDFNIIEPGKILDKTRELIIESFQISQKDNTIEDGMDIALCVLKDDNLLFAGANNSLVIIRNGKLIEIKGNKQHVGFSKFIEKLPFDTHAFALQKDDIIYLFSDGFQDQIGGSDGKRLKSNRFKQLLIKVHKEPLHVQKKLLVNFLIKWKQNYEQMDDICILGVKK